MARDALDTVEHVSSDAPKEVAPAPMAFTHALVTEQELQDSMDPTQAHNPLFTKTSYADSGEAALSQQEKDDRDLVASNVRNTLIARMKKENEASRKDAQDMSNEHQRHKDSEMKQATDKVKEKVNKAHIAYLEYQLALIKSGPADQMQIYRDSAEAIRNMDLQMSI